jgi:asparagine synthase (glutamine-hydrolysing)
MNLLFAKFTWDRDKQDSVKTDINTFNNGRIDLRVNRLPCLRSNNKNYSYDRETGTLCAMIGYLSNIGKLKSTYGLSYDCDVEIVQSLYATKQLDFLPELEGVFSILIYDHNAQKAHVFQDQHGCNVPIYYTKTDKGCIFSTSLKQLLKNTSMDRVFNFDAARDMLYYKTIIPNKFTLIKNLYKLTPSKRLIVDTKRQIIETRPLSRTEPKISRSLAKTELIKSIEDSTINLFNQLKQPEQPKQQELFLTLSGGFDTNLMLYILRSSTKAKIKALTLEGREDSEAPQAKAITEFYGDIEHVTFALPENSLDLLPNVIWRNEGYVYEEGMFTHHRMGRIFKEAGFDYALVGVGADQQLNHFRLSKVGKLRQSLKQRTIIGDLYFKLSGIESDAMLRRSKLGVRPQWPSLIPDITLHFLLKQNGIMLNSFGVQSIYPFLNRNTQMMGKALGILNDKKRFYKKKVRETLPPEVSQHIDKQGGAVGVRYLLDFDHRKDMITTVCDSGFIQNVLTKEQIGKIKADLPFYYEVLFHLFYLYCFNELFITRKYDSLFDTNELNLRLGELL